jgi:protein-disulfide isomerase
MSLTPNKAKERQEERRKLQQRRQLIIFAGIIVVGLLIVVGLALVANAPTDAPIATDSTTRYADLTRGSDDNGYPQLGRSNAKVQVIVYSSFSDSESLAFYKEVYPALLERVKKDEIALSFAPIKTASGGNPDGAARTALCAGEQGKFWEMHDTLFYWAELYGNSAFATNRIRAGLQNLDINGDTFNACFGSGKILDLLSKAQQGIGSTPTVKVNGAIINATLDEINTAIDGFAPFTRPENTPEATPEMTPESTPEATAESTDLGTAPVLSENTPEATPEMTPESTPEATAESTQNP